MDSSSAGGGTDRPLDDGEHSYTNVLSMLAEEMRAPLTVAKGYTQRLLMSWQTLDDHGKLAILDRINTSVSRMHRLVDDIAIVSGSSGGSFSMLARPFLLEPVIHRAIADVAARHGDRATAIVPAGKNVSMYGDQYRLEQVVLAVLELAVLRSLPDSPVGVDLRQEGEQARVSITLAGDVLTPADREALRAGGDGGTLDLYIAMRLLRVMGGSLDISSGTQATDLVLRLPVAAQ